MVSSLLPHLCSSQLAADAMHLRADWHVASPLNIVTVGVRHRIWPGEGSTVQWTWSPPSPGSLKAVLFPPRLNKVQNKGTQGARARYDAELPPFISIVLHPGRPLILGMDRCSRLPAEQDSRSLWLETVLGVRYRKGGTHCKGGGGLLWASTNLFGVALPSSTQTLRT